MAVAIPIGKVKAAVIAVTQSVPIKAEIIPARFGNLDGKLVKKSQFIQLKPLLKMSNMRIASIAIETTQDIRTNV
jgi:hypothetical protein